MLESPLGPLKKEDVEALGKATGKPFHWPPQKGEVYPLAAVSLAGIRESERKSGTSIDLVAAMQSVNRREGHEIFTREMMDMIGRLRS